MCPRLPAVDAAAVQTELPCAAGLTSGRLAGKKPGLPLFVLLTTLDENALCEPLYVVLPTVLFLYGETQLFMSGSALGFMHSRRVQLRQSAK